jgi:5-methylcytosine-specific restriction endonuclease McrBC regulatory subunit McrC
LPEYLREIASGRLLDIPCTYASHELDNIPNRTLRWALHLAEHLAENGASGKGEARRLRAHGFALRTLESRFAGVPLITIRSEDAWRNRLPQAFAHYEESGALPLARLLIRHVMIGSEIGGAQSFSLSCKMATVFERAFGASLERDLPYSKVEAQYNGIEALTVKDFTGQKAGCIRFRPDVYIGDLDGYRLVLDTKWKALLPERGRAAEEQTIDHNSVIDYQVDKDWMLRVRSADVAQILTYAILLRRAYSAKEKPVIGVLVYPSPKEFAPFEIQLPSGVPDDLRLFVAPWCIVKGERFQEATKVVNGLLDYFKTI